LIKQIGYDIDGCIVNSAPYFEMALMIHFDTTEIRHRDKDGNETFYFEIPGADPEDVAEIINYTIVKYHHAFREVQGAKHAIRYIECVGGGIPIYLTARKDYGGMVDKCWHDWVDSNMLPALYIYKRITEHAGKPLEIERLGITHYVEDRYKNAHQVAEVCEKVYLLDTSYNDRPLKADNIQRVSDWGQIIEDYLK
jgi:uncharacterized HAD superfamily protein